MEFLELEQPVLGITGQSGIGNETQSSFIVASPIVNISAAQSGQSSLPKLEPELVPIDGSQFLSASTLFKAGDGFSSPYFVTAEPFLVLSGPDSLTGVTLTTSSILGGSVHTDDGITPGTVSKPETRLQPSNQAPTSLSLSSASIAENVLAQSIVGTLSTTDPNRGNTFTYSLVSGTGATDNSAFTITGNQLKINASPDFETKSSYSIRVRTTDQGGLSFEKNLTVSIRNVNEAPTDLALSNSVISGNVAPGVVVGDFSTSDPDAKGRFAYSLVSGAGAIDNALFKIVDGQLKIKTSLGLDSKSSYSIRVRTTDQGGLSFEKILTITVKDTNQAPTNLVLSNNTTPENVVAGSAIGDFTTTDPNANDTFRYSLVTGNGDVDNTAFLVVGNQLKINVSPDFEAKSSYSIRVRTTDQGGLSFDKVLTIAITDVNEAPTQILLAGSMIAENSAQGTVIGEFATQDPDGGDTHTYQLLDDAGGRFQLVGTQLQVKNGALLDFEQATNHNITVKTTDRGGLSYETNLTISITDINDAPIDIVLDGDRILENAAGAVIGNITVTDPDAVASFINNTVTVSDIRFEVVDSNGILQLKLKDGLSLDYETEPTVAIALSATDAGNSALTYSKNFTIGVIDVNENIQSPSINAVLAKDTGVSNSDLLTLDPSVSGQTTNAIALLGSLNGNGFVDLSQALNPDGSFTISLKQYELLSNGSLPDGNYTLNLIARNSSGQSSQIAKVSFVLDRTPPALDFGLAPQSDTGVLGDSITTDRTVTLIGQTDPGLEVLLVGTQQTALADGTGQFTFTNVSMPVAGQAPFTLVVTDAAGNQGQVLNFLTRVGINGAPLITSTPEMVFDTTQQTIYTYQVTTVDPDGDPLTYSLLNAPQGAEIDNNGLLHFTPTGVLQPSYDFSIEVSDGRGGTDVQTFKVAVTAAPSPYGTIRGFKWEDLNGNGSRDIFNFDNFSTNTSSILLNGDTHIVPSVIPGAGDAVRLASAQPYVGGNALLQNPFDIVGTNGEILSFSSNFTFSISNSGGLGDEDGIGADGLTFIISPTQTVGSVGGGIGYAGLNNSVAVELDTYNNGGYDLDNGNHVGININGDLTAIAQTNIPTRFNNGEVWHVWIDYDGSSQLLEARVSQDSTRPLQATVSSTINIPQILGQQNIFVGFTSATGGGWGDHDILSWNFQTDEPGLSGVSVYLDTNNDGVLDNGEPVQVTAVDDPTTLNIDETGQYEFKDLLSGNYTVREVVPTGYIQTYPVASPGYYSVDLSAGQIVGNIDFGNTIDPTTANFAPVIKSIAPTHTSIGSQYAYQVVATDRNQDPLIYRLKNNPTGLTIDSNGLISWQPTALGTFPVEIEVDDSKGGIATQKFDLVVGQPFVDVVAPQVNLGFNGSVFNVGETLVQGGGDFYTIL